MSTAESTTQNPEMKAGDWPTLEATERALKQGIELKRWWEGVDAADKAGTAEGYIGKFKEAFVYERPENHSFGFFETCKTSTGDIPVIGNVQQQLYHRPKRGAEDAEFVKKQIKEFVLRYFMRISVCRGPQQVPDESSGNGLLKQPIQVPKTSGYKLQGFRYSQRYYKKTGDVARKFPESEQSAIIDMRDLKRDYDWMVVNNPIVDFVMQMRPLGINGPDLTLPIPSFNWLALSPDTITIDDNPDDDDLVGRYGIGYAFIKEDGKPWLFAYGPGQLEPTVQLLNWEIKKNGDVIVRMTFVSKAPEAILSISMNPLDVALVAADLFTAGLFRKYLEPLRRTVDMLPFSDVRFDPVYPAVRALNILTMGAAGKKLGISRDQINKTLTYVHFQKHYGAVEGSRQTWEQIPDWTDEGNLPDWVKRGESA